jgi:predicted enzyme related to lactoylglutathione lyase
VGTDVVAGQASRLGGRVVAPPFDTPFGRTAVLADPGDRTFSVIGHSNPIEGWDRAEVDDPYGD